MLMKMRHAAWILIFSMASLAVSPAFGNAHARAQEQVAETSETTARGLKLYEQGNDKEAIETLRAAVKQQKNDAVAWYYLGAASHRGGKIKDAHKAFEKAIQLRHDLAAAHAGLAYVLFLENNPREAAHEANLALKSDPQNADVHYFVGMLYLNAGAMKEAVSEADAALKLKPDLALAHLLRSEALTGLFGKEYPSDLVQAPNTSSKETRPVPYMRLKDAATSLETYLTLRPQDRNQNFLREHLETLRVYGKRADAAKNKDLFEAGADSATKPVILYKERALYTEEARQAKVQGTVKLLAVFTSDAKLEHILAVQWLSGGLTEQAVKAAHKIRFTPATKEGRSVSVIALIEFNFALY